MDLGIIHILKKNHEQDEGDVYGHSNYWIGYLFK
jgi:hypothetical protein